MSYILSPELHQTSHHLLCIVPTNVRRKGSLLLKVFHELATLCQFKYHNISTLKRLILQLEVPLSVVIHQVSNTRKPHFLQKGNLSLKSISLNCLKMMLLRFVYLNSKQLVLSAGKVDLSLSSISELRVKHIVLRRANDRNLFLYLHMKELLVLKSSLF